MSATTGVRPTRPRLELPTPVPARTGSAQPRHRFGRVKVWNNLQGWSFILPNFIGFAMLTLVPIVMPVLLRVHQLERVRPVRPASACRTSAGC